MTIGLHGTIYSLTMSDADTLYILFYSILYIYCRHDVGFGIFLFLFGFAAKFANPLDLDRRLSVASRIIIRPSGSCKLSTIDPGLIVGRVTNRPCGATPVYFSCRQQIFAPPKLVDYLTFLHTIRSYVGFSDHRCGPPQGQKRKR
jgi:hypothetical protein